MMEITGTDSFNKGEERAWMYACPFIAFALANFYTATCQPAIPIFDDVMQIFIPVALFVLPLILPLHSVQRLPIIIAMLLPETAFLTVVREWAEYGHTPLQDSTVWISAALACATAVVPIFFMAIIAAVRDLIQQKKGWPTPKGSASLGLN